MEPQRASLAVCIFAALMFVGSGFEFHLSDDSPYNEQLICSVDGNSSSLDIFTVIGLTISDVTKKITSIKMASIFVLENDLYIDHASKVYIDVQGSISQQDAHLVITFSNQTYCSFCSYLCELKYVTSTGQPVVVRKSVKTSRLENENPHELSVGTANQLVAAVNRLTDVADGIESSLTTLTQKLEKKLDNISDLLTKGPLAKANRDEYFDIINTGNKEWRLAFRGTPYINKSVYEAYKSGTGVHDNVEPECKQLDGTLSCQNHYRNNDVLDNWANIDKVALVLYQGKTKVKHMIFDGQGSTYMDWLSQARLELSSWINAKTETNNFFSIEGDSGIHRHFYLNRIYGGCPNDSGWFVAIDIAPGKCDEWESGQSFPVFKYSRGDTYTNWATGNVGTASLMAIFVKYIT